MSYALKRAVELVFSTPWQVVTEETRQASRLRLLMQTLAFASLTYAAMVLYYFEILPLWALVAANVLFYIRSYLRMHDLCHAFSARGWVIRFLPNCLFANPMWGGVAPFVTTHTQHHRYLGTDQDPWLPYYAGHPLRAFFFNMIEPETNFYNYVRQKGMPRTLVENLAFDVARHAVNLFFFQYAYLTHMLVQRACHGIGVFLFNFPMHREGFAAKAPLGSWNREKEIKPFAPLLRPFFGRALIEAAMYHNRHHIVGNICVPAHRYCQLSDDGPYTRYTKRWPLAEVQHLVHGPKGNLG